MVRKDLMYSTNTLQMEFELPLGNKASTTAVYWEPWKLSFHGWAATHKLHITKWNMQQWVVGKMSGLVQLNTGPMETGLVEWLTSPYHVTDWWTSLDLENTRWMLSFCAVTTMKFGGGSIVRDCFSWYELGPLHSVKGWLASAGYESILDDLVLLTLWQ